MPYLEEFALCDAFKWTVDDCENTAPEIRQVFLMILEARESARKSEISRPVTIALTRK